MTAYFQDGHCRVLVGTRALLGEGWDAKRITGLADLTAATTITSVVQTRGRALRTDPAWPEKVAVNWSLVCVSDKHPKGGNDWDRLVRKHAGFFGIDAEGQIVDGVAHLDPHFSPFAPPPVADFDATNARALVRSEQRAAIRAQWKVGEPYVDTALYTIRIKERGLPIFGSGLGAPEVVLRADAAELRGIRKHAARDKAMTWVTALALATAMVAGVVGAPLVLVGAAVVGAAAAVARVRSHFSRGEELLRSAEERTVGGANRLGSRRRPARGRPDPARLRRRRGGRGHRRGVPLRAPRGRLVRGRDLRDRARRGRVPDRAAALPDAALGPHQARALRE